MKPAGRGLVDDCARRSALLRRCLESMRRAVREIVVADTGSQDESREVAREYGARVLEIPWKDDFALARNQRLPREVHGSGCLRSTRTKCSISSRPSRKSTSDAGPRRLSGSIRNYVLQPGGPIWDRPARPQCGSTKPARSYSAYVDHENVRLFRRKPQIYFVGRVHESVGSRIESAGLGSGTHPSASIILAWLADDEATGAKNRIVPSIGTTKSCGDAGQRSSSAGTGLGRMEMQGNIAAALESFTRACELNSRLGVAWFFRRNGSRCG